MAVKTSDLGDPPPPVERSDELLAAACRAIARSGIRKLSMREVAEEAGVSKGLLHYYFSSRNELLARAYEYSDQRGRARVSGDVAMVESGAVRLSRLLDQYLSDDRQILEDWVLWSELSSSAIFDSELRPVMEAAFSRWRAWIEALVHDAMAEGSIPQQAEATETALRLIALTDGLGSLIVRGLIERETARAVLQRDLDVELQRPSTGPATTGDRVWPPATGYLRRLASLTGQAVSELAGLASTPEERDAIRTVSALIDSRAGSATAIRPQVPPQITYEPPDQVGTVGRSRPSFQSVARGATSDSVPTPAVIVDLDRLDHNLRAFASAVANLGVSLRPHVKAHKSLAVALRQLGLGAAGLAAAKPTEAEVFWQAGCRDIVIAYPVIGEDKWRRLARMARDGHVAVQVDSVIGVSGLSAAAREEGTRIGILIEVDAGLGRSGVAAEDLPAIEDLARLVIELPGIDLEGISSYRGLGSGAGPDPAQAGRVEGELMTGIAAYLRDRGIPIGSVAVGSTATALSAATVPGVTEVRAGVYPFMDGAQLVAGTATRSDIALTVLCTVVSMSAGGRVTIDGGSKTFSANGPALNGAYAISVDDRLRIESLNEEHGIGHLAPGATAQIGERIAFIPSYASSVVGLADELVAVRDGLVHEIWPVSARGARS